MLPLCLLCVFHLFSERYLLSKTYPMTLVLCHCLSTPSQEGLTHTLSLTAEERTRSRYFTQSDEGDTVYLQLPRGLVLKEGDILGTETGDRQYRVIAKPEAVMTVRAHHAIDLLRAAYHLGNRHIPLEITTTCLRLAPDPVLRRLLIEQLHLEVIDEMAPFMPELGAYQSGHKSDHRSDHRSGHKMTDHHEMDHHEDDYTGAPIDHLTNHLTNHLTDHHLEL